MKTYIVRFFFNALLYGAIVYLMDLCFDRTESIGYYLFAMLFFGFFMTLFNYFDDKRKEKKRPKWKSSPEEEALWDSLNQQTKPFRPADDDKNRIVKE